MKEINVSVLGATGYSGINLIKILSNHPNVKIASCTSKSYAGKKLSEIYSGIPADFDTVLQDVDYDKIAKLSEFAFLALPHGLSMQAAKELLDRGVKAIDLSGDYRYDNAHTYAEWYNMEHKYPELLDRAVYGLCEVYNYKIAKADLIANPGCYTTASILPLYPLLKEKIISDKHIIVDAKSGVSGAGRQEKLGYSFCEVNENMRAYSLANHRHTSEIEQELSKVSGKEVAISFSPHLLPVNRGILATIYADLNGEYTRDDILNVYKYYKNQPFVNIYAEGLPEIKNVARTNNINIGFVVDRRVNRLIIVSVLDNLIKGAAGQAVQNLNIMCALPEETGLNKFPYNI